MDGIYINGRRPKSKREVRDAVTNAPETVTVEITRFGHEHLIALDCVIGAVHFVGPDPYRSRKFYGTIEWKNGKATVK